MLGTDDDDQEPEEDAGPDDGMAELAVAADGDSVTADRLRGDEPYFPDCRPALQNGEQPHHIVHLTTVDQTLYASNGGHGQYGRGGFTHDLTADEGAVLLLTNDELLFVVDSIVGAVPYRRIQGTIRFGETISVHGIGGMSYAFHLANTSDPDEVAVGYDYLRRMVREHA